MRIHVVQGEREMAADNKTLGCFELVGISAAPRGTPRIEVTFDIDADGLVTVSAEDLETGLMQAIQITASSGLSEDAIEGLVNEAAANATSDRERRKFIELKNKAHELVYSAEKTLVALSDDISEGDRKALEAAIETTRDCLGSEASSSLQVAVDVLSELARKMG
jgi:molecular chaperone DnaK